jgi:hypothetical protein
MSDKANVFSKNVPFTRLQIAKFVTTVFLKHFSRHYNVQAKELALYPLLE